MARQTGGRSAGGAGASSRRSTAGARTRSRATRSGTNGTAPRRGRAPSRPADRPSNGSSGGPLEKIWTQLSERIQTGVPEADLDERDPDYIRDQLPFLWLLSSVYLRAEVRGMANIPEEGPVLLVGNHSGGNMIVDTFVFTLAFNTYFGVERPFYQLAHNLVLTLGRYMPWVPNLRKFGTVAASHDNADRALRAGGAVLVYPGGDYETHRPSWESSKVDFAGRKGFIELAMRNNVPIVPVVSIGGQETALFLSRGETLARLLRLDKMFRLKVLPISLALPWGINVGDMLTHIPLPAKITIDVLEPIDVKERFGPRPDPEKVYDEIIRVMQRDLSHLAAERRLPIIG